MAIPAEVKGLVFDGGAREQLQNLANFARRISENDFPKPYYNEAIKTQYDFEIIGDKLILKLLIPINDDGIPSSMEVRDLIELELSNELLFFCAKKLHDKAIRAKLVNDSLEGLE